MNLYIAEAIALSEQVVKFYRVILCDLALFQSFLSKTSLQNILNKSTACGTNVSLSGAIILLKNVC